jgi:hypothetical protein
MTESESLLRPRGPAGPSPPPRRRSAPEPPQCRAAPPSAGTWPRPSQQRRSMRRRRESPPPPPPPPPLAPLPVGTGRAVPAVRMPAALPLRRAARRRRDGRWRCWTRRRRRAWAAERGSGAGWGRRGGALRPRTRCRRLPETRCPSSTSPAGGGAAAAAGCRHRDAIRTAAVCSGPGCTPSHSCCADKTQANRMAHKTRFASSPHIVAHSLAGLPIFVVGGIWTEKPSAVVGGAGLRLAPGPYRRARNVL